MADRERTTATVVLDLDEAVYFRVPADWVCEREPDGLAVIYEDRPSSGTLRVWTECYVFDDRAARDGGVEALHDGAPPEPLRDGVSLSYAVADGDESGEALRLHRWRVAVPVGEDGLRAVTFIHTVEVAQEGGDQTAWELFSINAAVRNALYREASPTA